MRFKAKRLISFLLLSLFGLAIFCNLPIVSQTTTAISEPCSIPNTIKDNAGKPDIPVIFSLSSVNNYHDNEEVITKDKKKRNKAVMLGDKIVLGLKIDKIDVSPKGNSNSKSTSELLIDAETANKITSQLVLQIDGYSLKNNQGVFIEPKKLLFQLDYNEDSKNVWKNLLGPIWKAQREASVTLGCPQGLPRVDKSNKEVDNKIIIQIVNSRMLMMILPIITLIGVLFFRAFHDNLRGSGITRNRVFSLGRFQLAWWFYIIVITWILLFTTTGSFNDLIPAQCLILLGISTSTAIGGSVIDSSNDRQLDETDKLKLKKLDEAYQYITNKSNQKKLLEKAYQNIEGEKFKELSQLRINNEEFQFIIDICKDPKVPKLENIEEAKKSICKEMNKLEPQSNNFFADILTNPSGEINLHRYQIFIWSVVLGLVFIYSVLTTLKMPEFDVNLLTLQGISSGTFLALKSQEIPVNKDSQQKDSQEISSRKNENIKPMSPNAPPTDT
ncbi:hypothetical protein H6F42_13505 [Pseudanabaena sp. FACHB-1998]|nr:hypothetical protein [Pseudanabaena sp. FACHB-1998]